MTAGLTIEPLAQAHRRKDFSCGVAVLDRFLAELATQDVKRRVSNCFVLTDGAGTIAGFYTLAATSVPLGDLPAEDARKLPRYPVLPAVIIGRLAVDRRYRGRRLGGVLIMDAVARSNRSDPAIFALIVDAKDASAVSFYEHLGFRRFASRPMSLFLPMVTAIRALGAG